MHCSKCGATAPAGQSFCGSCGSRLSSGCPNCGGENPPDNRFCGSCGAQLSGATQVAPTEETQSTERRVVSVLFIDIVGFTSFSENRDHEEVRAMITRYFDLGKAVIERFGGTVDKFIGDAVMAWWGATESKEDDAERAVRAALDLVDRVAALGEELGIGGLAARAGVMTGEASVGPGGNERGLLLGDLVNSASRLQSLAEPGSVLVGRTTGELVADAVELSDFESHMVKGRAEPLEAARALEVVGERGGRGRANALTPPFTGRSGELRLLKDMLEASGRDGRARMVSLIGQAGIGKSRLVWEFRKYIDGLAENIYWHEGRSPSYGDGLSLWALGEMVRGRAGIGETESDEIGGQRLAEAVSNFIADPAERSWVESRLSVILGLGDNPGSERSELFAAARAFFEGVATHGTTVLVFEDLHWADQGLLEFVEELTDWSQAHPILIVAMARPDLLDRRPGWGSGRRGTASIHLSPLADGEMQELVHGTVPGIPDDAAQRIAAASGGVPLFAVETLRMLIGAGRLSVQDGVVLVSDDLEGLEVPQSVQAVVAARIDRLSADEKALVRDAAVLGHSFTLDGIAALSDEDVDKVERRLSDLVKHDIFEVNRDLRSAERGQYRWVQSVLREVAYGRIANADKYRLHLQSARYFRDLGDVELAPVAASHYLSASAVSGADDAFELEMSAALRSALQRAQSLHAHEQIIGLARSAVGLVNIDLGSDLREAAALSAASIGEVELADEYVSVMLADSEPETSAGRRAMWLAGKVANETRRPDRGLEMLRPHFDPLPDLSADAFLARSAVELARSELLTGNEVTAARLADEALGAVERFGDIESIADAMITRGTALAFRRYHQSMALLRGALGICREHNLSSTGLRCLVNIAYAGETLAESYEATVEAFDEAKRVGDRNYLSFIGGNLAGYQLARLDLDGVEALLAEPVFLKTPFDEASVNSSKAFVLGLRGDLDAAIEWLEPARESAGQVADPQAMMYVDRVSAAIDLLGGETERPFETHERTFMDHDIGKGFALGFAFDVATFAGDPAKLRRTLAMAEELSSAPGLSVDSIEAFAAFYEGEPEMLPKIEEWIDANIATGSAWAAVLACIGVSAHAPIAADERDRFRARALQISEDAGAAGLVALIESTTGSL